ncbi:histone-lysine N-methyltransferase SETDB1-A isoform X2 [Brachyhypopomus gauderio]|uniref:histone-lysine N-methyltransferase SETDB1-A isoform X2 n=1 Tax=Brachyhypopomus gauderio TaxID=698409 RepID=UPI00404348E6
MYGISDGHSAVMKIEEEEEDLDISEEQLRRWVHRKVEKDERVSQRRAQLAQVEEWVKQKERETTYTRLLYNSACESVLECESVMKGLYGMLGLEYRDTDSEEDEGAKSAKNIIQIADEEHDVEVGSDGDDDYVVIDLGATVPESLEDNQKVEEQSSVEVIDSRVIKPEPIPSSIMPPNTTSTPYKNIAEFFRQFANGSHMNMEPSPSTSNMEPSPNSPEPSIDPSEIKSRESPVPISSVPSADDLPASTLQEDTSPHPPADPSTDETMETPPLPTAGAAMGGVEPFASSANETSAGAEQDSSTKCPLSAPSTHVSRSSGEVLSNATISSGVKSSNTQMGKTSYTEKANNKPNTSNNKPNTSNNNPNLGKHPSTSATSSTPESSNTTQKTSHTEMGKSKAVSSITAVKTKESTSSSSASSQCAGTRTAKTSQSGAASQPSSVSSGVPIRVQQNVELKVDMNILGKRRTQTWHQGTIVEIRSTDSGQRYKVQFKDGKGKSVLSGHHLACVGSPTLKDLFVGCRVVACYKEENQSWLHAAVVTEMPDRRNRMRFLVFFDDGRPAYVALPDLHLVCTPLQNMCEDIEDEACRSQVEEYLRAYPNPIFVVVQVGQESKAERDGKMESCTINQVDGSLIQVCYKKDEEKEWFYKGSNRLEHIQRIKKKMAEKKKEQSSHQGRFIQRNNSLPTTVATKATTSTTLTTTTVDLKTSAASQSDASTLIAKAPIPISQPKVTLHRINLPNLPSVAPKTSVHMASVNTDPTVTSSPKTGTKRPAPEEDGRSGWTPALEARLKYVPHRCCPACLDQTRPDWKAEHRGKNPLLIPLLYGFRRMTARMRLEGKVKFHVFYRSPCGRSMGNMEKVQDFLFETRCDFLFLEMFCLDPYVLVRRAVVPSSMMLRPHLILPDISEGKEVIPVPCVNEVDSTPPPVVTYTRHRTPGPGVFINTSPDFLMGCDCVDGCRDRSKCSCHQLTIEATSLFVGGPVDASAGYMHKRLSRDLPTGVYECNPLCRCDPWMCSNRLVQHGLQLRLEVFMTQHKGWGVRCVDDLSKGTFVCLFTGKIVTDEMVNTESALTGNEFLANLDFIEGVEKLKDGYEDQAYCSDREGDGDKKTRVTMTTGALKKYAVFRRDSDSSSGEEKEKSTELKADDVCAAPLSKADAGDEDLYSDYDDTDDEDYKMVSDDDVDYKNFNVDYRKSYHTRRTTKVLDAGFEDVLTKTNQSISNSPKPIPKIPEDQTEVTSSMAKQMRAKGPGHGTLGFAKKSTRPFAIKSIHRKVKPEVVSNQQENSVRVGSTRSLFSGEKTCYLIDAKQEGNIARYINHSCSPNLLVQNVFVDTHDLRFPWVAFFTSKRIRAGTELTWDYSYEVGSVDGKVLLCCCGSDECTGRLL